MQNILIYGGIAINIIGAILLLAFAMKYSYTFYKAKSQPVRLNAMRPEWIKRRNTGFGLMIIGSAIAIVGCMI